MRKFFFLLLERKSWVKIVCGIFAEESAHRAVRKKSLRIRFQLDFRMKVANDVEIYGFFVKQKSLSGHSNAPTYREREKSQQMEFSFVFLLRPHGEHSCAPKGEEKAFLGWKILRVRLGDSGAGKCSKFF